ncbi:hypothetical protein THAOC_00637 [Thalassiosira oceanica]|uniref:Uncharacterized protein n=1 Tax=Thalassiosira oceanica TaxID=159749 RepID=K0TFJ6_THAOC|nr:hypothetical protein THAOC_00637 [Thalassiosira oceanica]|eukprot:EJK77528.1 hypothetical protein THAOC_00637 [Thalassiosira oceanica]
MSSAGGTEAVAPSLSEGAATRFAHGLSTMGPGLPGSLSHVCSSSTNNRTELSMVGETAARKRQWDAAGDFTQRMVELVGNPVIPSFFVAVVNGKFIPLIRPGFILAPGSDLHGDLFAFAGEPGVLEVINVKKEDIQAVTDFFALEENSAKNLRPKQRGGDETMQAVIVIPFPIKWVPFLLDRPDIKIAVQRTVAMIDSLEEPNRAPLRYIKEWLVGASQKKPPAANNAKSLLNAPLEPLVLDAVIGPGVQSAWE